MAKGRRTKQIGIAGISQIGTTDSGNACLLRVETIDGKELDLVFPARGATVFASRIMAAQAMAFGRPVDPPLTGETFTKDMPASLVAEHKAEPAPDNSLVLLTLRSGDANMVFGLPPALSAELRVDLEAAENTMTRNRSRMRN
jgi:hypothetical protein